MRSVRTLFPSPRPLLTALLLASLPPLAAANDDDGDGFLLSPVSALLSSNGVTVDPAGTRAYVSSSYGGITVIETPSHRYLTTFDVSRDVTLPSGIGYANGKLYLE